MNREKENQNSSHPARARDMGRRREDLGRNTRSVSTPQVIAILAAVASPTLLQAATQWAGLSLGGRVGAEEGLERSRRGSSPGNTVQAPGHSDGLGHGESWKGVGWSGPSGHAMGGFGGLGVLLLPTMPKTKQVPPSSNKPPVVKGDFFSSIQKRLFERNHRL